MPDSHWEESIVSWTKYCTALVAAGLVGCASTGSKSPIPTGGPPMIDIYRNAITETQNNGLRTDERVALLCDDLAGVDSKRECRRKALDRYLIAESDALEDDEPLPPKDLPPAPAPLYENFNRTADNEIRVLFPRLPNPDIAIYIYPHLATKNRVPVPGYATVIPLYEQVQYALPGEPHQRLVR
jgi:hypothetical protein